VNTEYHVVGYRIKDRALVRAFGPCVHATRDGAEWCCRQWEDARSELEWRVEQVKR
jgi:hypothetical protein